MTRCFMRVKINKTKNFEQLYIIRDIYNNGNRKTVIQEKLGRINELMDKMHMSRDEVIDWAKSRADQLTSDFNKSRDKVSIDFYPHRIIDKDVVNLKNCGYLFPQSVYYQLHFKNIIRNIRNRHNFKFDLDAILSDLIYTRFISPSSKLSSFKTAKTLLEPPKYQLQDIYRALHILAEESDYIQNQLYRNSNFIHKRNDHILYYDCTNYYFEIEQEDRNKKYGKSKENRPNPIIGMGLFMDADGFPLAFDLFPGNRNEQITLKPLEQKIINDFGCSKFVYCSDSGLASKSNKVFNSTGGKAYVIAQSLKKLKKEEQEVALNPKQYRKLGSEHFIDISKLDESDPEVYNSIYYKEIPLGTKGIDEVLIVTYSPKYRSYQSTIRARQIERANKMISNNEKVKKTRKNPNDPARFIKSMAVTANGEVADKKFFYLDEDQIAKEAMFDGFYAVCTNLDDDVSTIININKRRWQIEECFRIMKTEFKARPVFLQREDCIKAHFLTCFISLLIFRIIENKLEYKYTVAEIIDTIKNMNVLDTQMDGYLPAYTRTDLTDKLHEVFNFRTDYHYLSKSYIRNIIKKSKK